MGPPTHRESHLPFGVLREMSRDRTEHVAADAGRLPPRGTGAIRPDTPIAVSSPDGVVSRDLLRRLLRRLRICPFCVVLVGFVMADDASSHHPDLAMTSHVARDA